MIITIDTSKDSHEEIKKAIRLLQSINGESFSNEPKNIFDSPSTNIFDSPAPSAPSSEPAPASSFGAMFGSDAPVAKPEEKKERFQIEPYD